jgi:ParB family chromosome partitioning protein
VAVSNLMRLLDLPDEALELLESGYLTEGHGRALLLAPDHAERRRLARTAAAEGWTVRETEARAREAAAPAVPSVPAPRRAGAVHPDHEEAATRLGEALSRTLGADVRVTPRGDGFKVSMSFDSVDDALAMAERVGALESA